MDQNSNLNQDNVNTQGDNQIQNSNNIESINYTNNQGMNNNMYNQPYVGNKKNKKTALIITISVVAVLMITIFGLFIGHSFNKINKTKTFYGNGFELKYNYKWRTTTAKTSSGDRDALASNIENAYISQSGISSLKQFENSYNIDFDTEKGKMKVYDEFYDYFNSGDEITLHLGSDGFYFLKDDIYFANMDYSQNSLGDDIVGKVYIIVSKSKNAIISFMTVSTDKGDEEIFDLLKSIEIYDYEVEEDDDEYDDKLNSILDSMRNWNWYSDVREGELGTKLNLNGEWRILSDSETTWEFRNGEFWYRKSYNVLDDNYWYGTYEVKRGKEGIRLADLNEDNVDKIVSNTSGKVSENDIYTVILKPTKIISGGIDKSSTNIPEDMDWKMVWILVDHDDEGIEAQTLNVSNYDISYYVKVKD